MASKNKTMETYLIAGLGNFGKRYENTRHNTGFMALDYLAESLGVSVSVNKFKALCGQTNRKGAKVLLMKPLTFMNLSGEAIRLGSLYFDIPPQNIIIIFDDVDLNLGHIRVRPKGSAGSHNGMKSIIKCLGSEYFPRVRIGIGPKTNDNEDLADFVLGHFSEDSEKLVDKACGVAASAALCIIDEGVSVAMNRYNGVDLGLVCS